MKKYRVLIEEITTEQTKDSSYKEIYGEDELQDRIEKKQIPEDTKRYGYVYYDEWKTKAKAVFDQTVDELDMTAVIKAVNNI